MKIYWKTCTKTAPVLRGIKTSHGFVSAGYSPERRSGQLFSIGRTGSPLCRAGNQGQRFQCPQGLFKGKQLGKETQKEILKAMHRKSIKDREFETVINGPRKDTVRQEIRAASGTTYPKKEQGKEEDPVLSPKREDTRKETEKEISRGMDPKVLVRQESQINRTALISRRSNVIGSHQNAHITNPK